MRKKQSGVNRSDRVAQQIKKELGQIFLNGLKDPRIGFITITEVRLTKDLRHATVFFSIYGDEQARLNGLEGLKDSKGFLKKELAHRTHLRFLPELHFEIDRTLDQAQRIEDVLTQIKSGKTEVTDTKVEFAPIVNDRSQRKEASDALPNREQVKKSPKDKILDSKYGL